MPRESLGRSGALERMADAACAHCAGALDGAESLLPTLMVWYEGEDLSNPGAVVVFESPSGPAGRPGDALRTARERLDSFTRGAAAWALAYEGLVSENGDSSAAVIVEATLRRPPAEATLARRYRPRRGRQPFTWIGEVARV